MDFPRFPDWLVYLAASSAILIGALGRRERLNAPEPPPSPPGAENVPLSPDSPFDPITVIRTANHRARIRGTAFAAADGGVWLTARANVTGCAEPALEVSEGRAVRARLGDLDDPQLAALITDGGPPGVPLAAEVEAVAGTRGYLAGFPRGGPGEASALLVTRKQARLLWGQTGQTAGLKGALYGMAGAPMINGENHVVGVLLAQDKRRGRFITTAPSSLSAAVAALGANPGLNAPPTAITPENYGRAADDLRRAGQVVEVLCLKDRR